MAINNLLNIHKKYLSKQLFKNSHIIWWSKQIILYINPGKTCLLLKKICTIEYLQTLSTYRSVY